MNRTSRGGMKALTFVVSLGAIAAANLATPSAQQPSASQGQVTFAKDVAPILQRSCQNCHRPGSVAPMSLITYEDARPWARSIKTRVSKREMPPWGIDKNVGIQEFKEDISLTDDELAKVVKWVDDGAPMGNAADMPAPLTFTDNRPWHIGNGKPDLIVSMPKPFKVPAIGADVTLEFLAETGLTEDRYLKAIETKPDPRSLKVVHHAALDLVEPGNGLDASRENYGMGGARSFLSEYALGKDADIFPEDTGRLVKAGSKVNFNMHYYSTGEEVESMTSVGMVFYPKGYVPKHVVITQHIGENADLDIPAGTIGRVDGYTTLSHNAQMVMIQPHMHSRGKRQCVEAILPADDWRSLQRQWHQDRAHYAQLHQLRHELEHFVQVQGRDGARAAEGNGHPHHVLVRQHHVQVQPGFEKLGGEWTAVGRHHELPVAKLLLPHRRGIRAEGEGARRESPLHQ